MSHHVPTEYQRICLVHYHEIGLKGHNRSTFEMRLIKNLEALLKDYPVERIHRISGRVCINLEPDATEEQSRQMAERIKWVPGAARVSSGYICEREMDHIYKAAHMAMDDVDEFVTFKVAARRNHTDFPTTSMEINQLVGAFLCDLYPDKIVKMKNPDVVCNVEVIEGSAFIFARSERAIGGLPVGSSGKVVSLLSSGIDSPVALWRIARRGAVCIGVHFSGRPQTSSSSEFLVDDIAHVLEKSGCIARIYVVPFGDYQREIASIVDPSLRILMYRRLMFRIAGEIARKEGAKALVTGESLGQVASQTIENIAATADAVDIPIFRPLIGADKLEIIEQAQQLGTFEISSQDAPDCCTLFMPRKPETHARIKDVRAAEEKLPIEQWVETIMSDVEVTDYRCASYKPHKVRKSAAV